MTNMAALGYLQVALDMDKVINKEQKENIVANMYPEVLISYMIYYRL